MNYPIVEIFESLQGEGFNTGMPSIFIRFGRCSLACPWCDTNYHNYQMQSAEKILKHIKKFKSQNIIITGGEPSIVPEIEQLLNTLKKQNYRLHIESNGLHPIPQHIDYIAISPKRLYRKKYQKQTLKHVDEIRIVMDGDDCIGFCLEIENKIKAKHHYLSPCEQNGQINLKDTITTLYTLNQQAKNPWRLSLQTHKIIGIE